MAAAGDPQRGARLLRQAGAAIHLRDQRMDALFGRVAALVAEAPLRVGHPELDAEPLREPAREADMVGVIMRADEARDGLALKLTGEDALPQRLGLSGVDAGIDDRPTRAVGDEPEVDVVKGEGKRHTQPTHARRNLPCRSRRRRRRMRKAQGGEPAAIMRTHSLLVTRVRRARRWQRCLGRRQCTW